MSEHNAQITRATSAGMALRAEWDVSGDCESPVPLETFGTTATRTDKGNLPALKGDRGVFTLQTYARCRVCPPCRRYRTRMWTARAVAELQRAERTWFCTLTLNAHEQFMAETRARGAVAREGLSWWALEPEERFARRAIACSDLLTKFLKRLRKNSGAKIRYCLVTEAHKTDLPHFHLLVHEVPGSEPIRYRTLKGCWNHGFSNFKLCGREPHTAYYLCKYLAKSALARIRASTSYGRLAETDLTSETPGVAGVVSTHVPLTQTPQGGRENKGVSA